MDLASYLRACHAVQSNSYVYAFTSSILPSLITWLAHYVSAFLTVGSMVIINLRILGWLGKKRSITEIADFYSPWMWTGLGVLTFTGLLMLAGDSDLFCTNGIFGINLLVTALAAISGVLVKKNAPAWDRPSGAPLGGKILAGISILLWVGTILSAVEVPARSGVP
jgi:hypothetical protein